FVGIVLFGACYAMRSRKHITFSLVYSKLKPKPAAFSRLAGDLIIMAIFIILLIPSLRYSLSLHLLKTTSLKINYTYIFLPFIYLVLSVIGYTIVEMIEDFKVLRGSLADSAAHMREEYTK
ncbi:MAG: TRAP transporter small permease subunit, partial [Candidatus Shapirobacteria bacterium]